MYVGVLLSGREPDCARYSCCVVIGGLLAGSTVYDVGGSY